MVDIFIIGSKGIPANYGGFETFVDCLVRKKKSSMIRYHIACLGDDNTEFRYKNDRCFNVKVPQIGSARAVFYDLKSLSRCIKYIEKHKLQNSIIYVLACRIGPFMFLFSHKIKALNIKVYVNPDGHEWLRSKWNKWIQRYWKYSEKLMVKHSDLLICDSNAIEAYIKEEYFYYSPETIFIPYGADIDNMSISADYRKWCEAHSVLPNSYYLIVGRFVPENNYEIMIREFMASDTQRDLVIICNLEKNNFYKLLYDHTNFKQDKRIKFVGTVYDKALLKQIRQEAYAYIHGHEVGGTNPSLLEAMAATKINILLDVVFNKEVGKKAVLYFNKKEGSLREIIEKAEKLDSEEIMMLSTNCKKRIEEQYGWEKVSKEYESLFLDMQHNEHMK